MVFLRKRPRLLLQGHAEFVSCGSLNSDECKHSEDFEELGHGCPQESQLRCRIDPFPDL